MLTVTAAKNVRKFFQNNEFPPFRQDDSGEGKLEVTAPGPGIWALSKLRCVDIR
jgi:hypothetical protein